MSCNFDSANTCSLTQASGDAGGDIFDWSVIKGGTPSKFTGPSRDHGTSNLEGYYAYIETTDPRVGNQMLLSALTMIVWRMYKRCL